MTTYTDIFGGATIYPSGESYLALTLTESVTLQWPLSTVSGSDIVASIIDLSSDVASLTVTMPDATETSNGIQTVFNNVGTETVTILDADGGTIQAVISGVTWVTYLANNTDAAGTWRTFQLGAGTSSVNAASLVGAGLQANGITLEQIIPPTSESTGPVIWSDANRALLTIWTGGTDVLDLPDPTAVGTNWFAMIRNQGSGDIVLTPFASETIDDLDTLTIAPDSSATVVTDGTNYFTIGLGKTSTTFFDFTSIDITLGDDPGTYTLSGTELNRISYNFTGAITEDWTIVVPATAQQYWVDNSTTGSFDLFIEVSGSAVQLQIDQDTRVITYSNGTDILNASDTASITLPLVISQGGTGETTASAALSALGGITGITVENEGSALATAGTTMDFVGGAVTASGTGTDKTITIALEASTAASTMLRGDGSDGWEEVTLATLSATGDFAISDGTNAINLSISSGLANFNGTGTVDYMTTDFPWRFSEPLKIAESSGSITNTGGYGQVWCEENNTGTNPCTMHYEDDAGNDYRIDGVQRRALLIDVVTTNNDTLTTIANFSNFHIAPDRYYHCRATFFAKGAASSSLKFQLAYSETAEEAGWVGWTAHSIDGTASSFAGVIPGNGGGLGVVNVVLTGTGIFKVLIDFCFESHATNAGTLDVQFAQVTSSAVITELYKTSFFEVTENDNIS